MFAYVLKNNLPQIMDCKNFTELGNIIKLFPEKMQKDYSLAKDFSEFNYLLRVVYNIVLSDGNNEEANEIFDDLYSDIKDIANIDLDEIFNRTSAYRNPMMCKFLRDSKRAVLEDNISELKKIISRREIFLKGSGRARCAHPGEFDSTEWFGGGKLYYRFDNAIKIIKDIREGIGEC